MKEFKGTKDFEINIQSDKRVILNSTSQEDDVDIWAFDDLEVANANAKIFKAAPKLLEALQGFTDFPEEDLKEWSESESLITITVSGTDFKKAMAAISKALD